MERNLPSVRRTTSGLFQRGETVYNEVDSGNTESVGKRKRKCVSVAVVRSKNTYRKPRVAKVTIKRQIKK